MSGKKKSPGPSKAGGVGSLFIGAMALTWTVGTYVQRGPGAEAGLGFILVVFCLVHAAYNFQGAARRRKAGETREKAAIKTGKYPVCRVKHRPIHTGKRSAKRGA